MNDDEIRDMKGLTFQAVEVVQDKEVLVFTESPGRGFQFSHDQDCCECVEVYDVCGDLSDLVGSPLLVAEERTSESQPDDVSREYQPDSQTWTFYEFATVKGSVTVRWLGESNGYYSEDVEVHRFGTEEAAALAERMDT